MSPHFASESSPIVWARLVVGCHTALTPNPSHPARSNIAPVSSGSVAIRAVEVVAGGTRQQSRVRFWLLRGCTFVPNEPHKNLPHCSKLPDCVVWRDGVFWAYLTERSARAPRAMGPHFHSNCRDALRPQESVNARPQLSWQRRSVKRAARAVRRRALTPLEAHKETFPERKETFEKIFGQKAPILFVKSF